MSKITYAKLGLKTDTGANIFAFNGQNVEVLKYLPISEKQDIIQIALQKAALDNGTYDDLLLDEYFALNIVYGYSNITFTAKQREDEDKLYDQMESSGFLESFFVTMDSKEYKYLFDNLNAIRDRNEKANAAAGNVITKIVNDLPKNAEAAAKLVDSFDPEKYQNVIKLAQNAGMRKS